MKNYAAKLIKARLARDIVDGRYRVNEALPKISELAKQFSVSVTTVQKAIHALRLEGLVETSRGQGVFVRQRRIEKLKGKRIGLLGPFHKGYLEGTPWPGLVISALRKRLNKEGLKLVEYPLLDLKGVDVLEYISQQKLAALIVFELEDDRLLLDIRDRGLPLVSMDYDAFRHWIPSVSFDNSWGAFEATRHLIRAGHRHIAFLRNVTLHNQRQRELFVTPRHLESAEEERLKGYRMAMQDAGLPVLDDQRYLEALRSGGPVEVIDILFQQPRPTALLCGSDPLANLCIRAVQERGFNVPSDISILGFGDSQRTFERGRKISSVWVDHRGMGEQGAQLLLEASRGLPPRRILLPTRLALNHSHGPMNPAPNESGKGLKGNREPALGKTR